MTRQELAEALGVATRTIGLWEAAGMPVRSPGGKGRGRTGDYELSACRAWASDNGRGYQMRTMVASERTARRSEQTAVPDIEAILLGARAGIVAGLMGESGQTFETACIAFDLVAVAIAQAADQCGAEIDLLALQSPASHFLCEPERVALRRQIEAMADEIRTACTAESNGGHSPSDDHPHDADN